MNEKPLRNTQNWPKSEPDFDPNLPKDTMRKKFAFKIHSKISKMTPKTKNTLKFDHFRVQFKDPYFSKDAMRKKIRSKKAPKNFSRRPQNVKIFTILSVTNIFELRSFPKTTKCLPSSVILERPLDWKKLIFDTYKFTNFNAEYECQFLKTS